LAIERRKSFGLKMAALIYLLYECFVPVFMSKQHEVGSILICDGGGLMFELPNLKQVTLQCYV
jgi:hypothetical protein